MENQDTVKQAARRMCEHLKTQGVEVKHGLMLETLAKSFGLDNWRTLKAVIDAPRAAPVVEPVKLALPLGEWQTWIVSGIYTDNDQQYGDHFSGRTPLEGAINGLLDRLTDFGNVINITEVCDADGKMVFSPNFITEVQLFTNRTALEMLFAGLPKTLATAELEMLKGWLKGVLDEYPKDDLSELTDWDTAEKCSQAKVATIGDGCVHQPTKALELLCEAAESQFASIMVMEEKNEPLALACFQVRATCAYFGEVLDSADYSPLVDFELDLPA